jgi:hypothetical protein
MRKYEYTQSNTDYTSFYRKRHEKVVVLIIYIDDMIITCEDHIAIICNTFCIYISKTIMSSKKYFATSTTVQVNYGSVNCRSVMKLEMPKYSFPVI